MASNATGHHQDTTKPGKVDEQLWAECRSALPAKKPPRDQLPYYCGSIVYHGSGGPVQVYLIDGAKTLLDHDMDFVEGGNGLEDPDLCGHDEIVLDWLHDLDDLKYILYHEAYERRLMLQKKMQYGHAHELTNESEKALRMQNA